MDYTKVLGELRTEHQRLNEAIEVMERLAAGKTRRGRPPLWMTKHRANGAAPRRGRPPGSKNKPKGSAE